MDAVREARQRRAAKNQSLFREVNERINGTVRTFTATSVEYVCECSREECTDLLPLTVEEYESIRANPTHFIVKPGHVDEAVERVVGGEADRYEVVEKFGEAANAATRLDPRTRTSQG